MKKKMNEELFEKLVKEQNFKEINNFINEKITTLYDHYKNTGRVLASSGSSTGLNF